MSLKLKYKIAANKAGTTPDPIANQLLEEAEAQKKNFVNQIEFLLKEGGPELETKFYKWMAEDFGNSILGDIKKDIFPEIS